MTLHDLYLERAATPSDINEHLGYMHDRAVETGVRTVVELGVRSGNSTAALLAAVTETGGRLWSVDCEPPDVPREFTDGPWTLIIGDDLAVADQLPDSIDLLFIDTSHHYQHTLDELRLYGPRSTWILLHDTELEHPYQAPAGDPPYPVLRAVRKWSEEVGRQVEYQSNCWGLATIHPPR
jgi:cephalosporin hydroxylase